MDALSNHCFRGVYAVSRRRRRRPFSFSYYSKVFHSCGDSIFVEKKHTQWIPPSASSSPAGEGIVESRIQNSCESSQLRSLSKTVHVRVVLKKACLFGQQFLLVGGDAILSLWDPADAILMDWSEGDVWTAELDLPIGKLYEFKLILRGLSGEIYWQPGPDRVLQVWETTKTIVVTEDWENAENQKVVEEESLAIPTEEVIYTENKISTETVSLANETQMIRPSETTSLPAVVAAEDCNLLQLSGEQEDEDLLEVEETITLWGKVEEDDGSSEETMALCGKAEDDDGSYEETTTLWGKVEEDDGSSEKTMALCGKAEEEDGSSEETKTLWGKVEEEDGSSEETMALCGKAEDDDGSSEETTTLLGKVEEDDGSSEKTMALCGKAEDGDDSSKETTTLLGKVDEEDGSSDDGDSPEGFDSQATGGGVIRNSNLWGINTLHQLLLNLGFKINPPPI